MSDLKRKKPGVTLEMDKLVDCPCCGSNACYESEFNTQEGNVKTWLCMTCGYTSNTTMTEDNELIKESFELTAEIIKDNIQIHDNLIWLLTVITMPDKGMIFPEPIEGTSTLDALDDDGKGQQDWAWTVVKAIEIPEDEQHKYPDPNNKGSFYKKRMDMKNMKRYDKLAFMDAAEELGMFDPNLVINED